jgi:hypothetical protein
MDLWTDPLGRRNHGRRRDRLPRAKLRSRSRQRAILKNRSSGVFPCAAVILYIPAVVQPQVATAKENGTISLPDGVAQTMHRITTTSYVAHLSGDAVAQLAGSVFQIKTSDQLRSDRQTRGLISKRFQPPV